MAEDKKESDESDTIKTPSSKSTLIKTSVLTLNELLEQLSLSDAFLDQYSEGLHSIKSTELICNEEECFTFKYIPDPGIYQAYVIGADSVPKEESDEEIYLRLVKNAGIAPLKRIVNSFKGYYLGLEHYGLDPRQMKPLTEALKHNTTVQELNLRCNVLSVDALYHLGLLTSNISGPLRKLNLQHCKIGPEGVAVLVSGLEVCNLEELDLSHNEIGDSGMEELAGKLSYNISIQKLNLSHNGLTQQSGMWLADTMEENTVLEHLDLSWNRISEEPGLKKFLTSAAESNEGLLYLNLSWNSLGGDKIATIIKNFIGQHKTIEELDLSYNRLGSISENTRIAKGISTSETLKTLDMSYNGHTADSAFALLFNIGKAKLQTLLLTNVWVKPEFEKLQKYGGLKVKVEGVSGGLHIKGPDVKEMILKRANYLGYKPKKNKKDFGWFLLRLQKAGTLAPVKKAKFDLLVQEDKIKFDEGLIDELAKQFRNEVKKIDLNLMLEKYFEIFPDTALPVPKEKKKKKHFKDEKKHRGSEKEVKKQDSKVTEDLKRESKEKELPKHEVESTEERKKTTIDTEDRRSKTVKASAREFPDSILVKKTSTQSKEHRKSKKEVTFLDENINEENNIEAKVETDQIEVSFDVSEHKEIQQETELVQEETVLDTTDTDKPVEEVAEDIEEEKPQEPVHWKLKQKKN